MNQSTLDKASIYLLQKGVNIDGMSDMDVLEAAVEQFLAPGGDRELALKARFQRQADKE